MLQFFLKNTNLLILFLNLYKAINLSKFKTRHKNILLIYFQFEARNEKGEGDNNVEYRLITSEPKDSFTLDPNTGVVRTFLKEYARGEYYKIFVQARDRRSNALKAHKESEIEILELYCGDLPPQFFETIYKAEIPENLEVGHR